MIRKFHLGAISAFSTFFTNLVHCDQSYTKEEVSKNNGMNVQRIEKLNLIQIPYLFFLNF